MGTIHYTSASAGTGKTYTLTHKVADLIKSKDLDPGKAIITTFTKAAASELKQKTRAVLYEEKLFDAAVKLDASQIGTIHSIAQSFILKYWQFLKLSPDMKVLEPEGFTAYTADILARPDVVSDSDKANFAMVQELFNLLKSEDGIKKPDLDYWRNWSLDIMDLDSRLALTEEEFLEDRRMCMDEIRRVFNRSNGVSDVQAINSAAELCDAYAGFYTNNVPDNNKDKGDPYYDYLISHSDPGKPLTPQWIRSYKGLYDIVFSAQKRAAFLGGATPVHFCRIGMVMDAVVACAESIYNIVEKTRKAVNEQKKLDHILTFNDLELYFYKLLKEREIVKDEIRDSFTHLFVDEFQDSSTMQVKLFMELADILGRENCWFFGDWKQVIYSWREAAVKLTTAISNDKSLVDEKDTLDTSYRSRKEVVEFCNRIFSRVLAENGADMPALKVNKKGMGSVEIWDVHPDKNGNSILVDSSEYVAGGIAEFIRSGIKAGDIAVLGFKNSHLKKVAGALENLNIDTDYIDNGIWENKEVRMVFALLENLREQNRGKEPGENGSKVSKAVIKQLTTPEYNVNAMLAECMVDEPGMEFRIADIDYAGLSVSELVRQVIFKNDLFDLCRRWGNAESRKSNLFKLIELAEQYDAQCAGHCIPATIDGFQDKVRALRHEMTTNPDAVHLYTIHTAKGLEWPVVIVLDDIEFEESKVLPDEVCGVHAVSFEKITSDNLYPRKHIFFFPQLFTSFKPGDQIGDLLLADGSKTSECYRIQREARKNEVDRLGYVAFTRARNDLRICDTTDDRKKKKDSKDKFYIACYKSAGSENREKLDPIISRKRRPALANPIPGATVFDSRSFNRKKDTPDSLRRDYTPSELEKGLLPDYGGEVAEKPVWLGTPDDRIRLVGARVADDVWGSCIHHIFGVSPLWQDEPGEKTITDIAARYGVQFEDASKVRHAWERLTGYISDNYGEIESMSHEMPFRFQDNAGRCFNGSMDLVVKTAKGYIIVDYKTFQGNDVTDHTRKEKYAAQLACYKAALEADGKTVAGTFVYYPVTRAVVSIS